MIKYSHDKVWDIEMDFGSSVTLTKSFRYIKSCLSDSLHVSYKKITVLKLCSFAFFFFLQHKLNLKATICSSQKQQNHMKSRTRMTLDSNHLNYWGHREKNENRNTEPGGIASLNHVSLSMLPLKE